MTLLRPLALFVVLALATAARADFTVDFADHPLPAGSFDNGSNGAGGFVSNGAFFNNSYDTTYGSWSGWSLSNVNNVATAGYGNQYAAITGAAPSGSGTYAVAYDGSPNGSFINLPGGAAPVSIDVTNTTYAYLSMLNGDQFAKQFGSGDFLQLQITGYAGANATGTKVGEVDVDLARYTADANHPVVVDPPLNVWKSVGLTPLASAQSLGFTMASSDVGPFGINTPTYFAVDDLKLQSASNGVPVPEPSSLLLVGTGLIGLIAAGARRRIGVRT